MTNMTMSYDNVAAPTCSNMGRASSTSCAWSTPAAASTILQHSSTQGQQQHAQHGAANASLPCYVLPLSPCSTYSSTIFAVQSSGVSTVVRVCTRTLPSEPSETQPAPTTHIPHHCEKTYQPAPSRHHPPWPRVVRGHEAVQHLGLEGGERLRGGDQGVAQRTLGGGGGSTAGGTYEQ